MSRQNHMNMARGFADHVQSCFFSVSSTRCSSYPRLVELFSSRILLETASEHAREIKRECVESKVSNEGERLRV